MHPTEFTPSPDTERAFRNALGRFATGITVVTTQAPQGPMGITANSFASVSLDPPLVLWSPAKTSRRFAEFQAAKRFAIHVLAEDQPAVCQQFSREGLNFDGLDWAENADGVPLINGGRARFDCRLEAQHDGGDHVIILGRVLACTERPGAPLIY